MELNLADAYELFGCSSASRDEELKRRCRELMAQYHPDVIAGKKLAPGFVE